MGLSASQARLLSITARLTHNETQSQLITNAKLRLADKSAEASKEYMEALNTTKFVYMNYDNTGLRQTEDFTVGGVYQFSDIKNQYGFVDAQGRLLVSSVEAENYARSATLAEFLSCYGVGDATNPKYENALRDIYGDNYGAWYSENNPDAWLATVNNATSDAVDDMVTNANGIGNFNQTLLQDEAAYNAWVEKLKNSVDGINFNDEKTEGLFNSYVDAITDVPDYMAQPTKPADAYIQEVPSLKGVWDVFKNAVCLTSTGGDSSNNFKFSAGDVPSDGEMWHMEHSLSKALHACGEEVTFTVYPGTSQETTFTLKASTYGDFENSNSGYSEAIYGADAAAMREALVEFPEVKQNLINTYYEILRSCSSFTPNDTAGSYTDNGTSVKTAAEIATMWNALMDDFVSGATNSEEAQRIEEQNAIELARYEREMEEYEAAMQEWRLKFLGELQNWNEKMKNAQAKYTDTLHNLPAKTVPNENDPKYQWYTNLWFRMGGISSATKEENDNKYKVLEEYYMYNADWLKFALQHGIVTMEQVEFQEEGSLYPLPDEMNNYAWASIQHGNCADMYEETDELAIARAEVKYQQATSEIQAKDKKYDTDLKKLDTTHTALQTEYDAIKSVIDKNVDRSFKAFS